ncbi:MAG: GntR family transcriptional regulator [Betaproteobacteria bacterium]
MMHKTSQTNTLVEEAFAQVRRRILDNVWPPGYRALEQEVAAALDMSRTPVREALVRLQAEGLIDLIPRHGMHVLPVSATQMAEIYELLTALECLAVEKIARGKLPTNKIQVLINATDAMEEALERDDLQSWAVADEAFHAELIALAGNKTLEANVLSLADRVHRARMFSFRLRPKPLASPQDHRIFVERIIAGDIAGAIAANREHRERASHELLAIFSQYKFQHL